MRRPLLQLGYFTLCSSQFKRSILSSPLKIRHLTTTSSKMLSTDTSKDEVLFETINGKGIITLNRPRALNALSHTMIKKIYPQLKAWESANKQFVIIKGSGEKAFCAGGDVRAVTESAKEGTKMYQEFFKDEYQLNNLIGTLTVPYIAVIDGICMGGGVGLSVHGPYRVATERTQFAMPETAIGLFPDVGGSYFLPRLGGKLGLYLALTGYRLKGGDVFRAGVATHMCPSYLLPSLEQDLIGLNSNKPQDIEKILQKFHTQCPEARTTFSLESKLPLINSIFDGKSVEDIMKRLESEGSEWSQKTFVTLSAMSPTSLKITFKILELGATMDLQECLHLEYRLTQRCCEDNDFVEGVRAMLVDKDQSPKWKPNSLAGVTDATVERYLSPLPDNRDITV